MKKLTSIVLTAVLVCFMSISAMAETLPTWTYSFSHQLVDSNNNAIDIDFYDNLSPIEGYTSVWNTKYFGFPLVEFDFWELESKYGKDIDATLISTVSLNDGAGNTADISLNFSMAAANYGNDYTLTFVPTIELIIFEDYAYEVQLDTYKFKSGGKVDTYDYFKLEYELSLISSTYVGSKGNDPIIPTATPEPATMLLMGIGLAGLGFMARRRRS